MHPSLDVVLRFESTGYVARAISVLFGLSIGLTFLEKLTQVSDFDSNGWFPWRIFRFDRLQLSIIRKFPTMFERLFCPAGMSVAFASGLLAVGVMFLSPVSSWPFALAMAVIVGVILLLHVRSTYGGDGSQQMNLLIGSALLLGFNPLVKPAVGTVGLLFITAQSCLAYFTSGMAKVVSPVWTRGDPLVGIFSTTAYGSPLGLRLVSVDSRVRRALCLGMVLLETLFPLAVIGPRPVLVFFLVWGVAFHTSNAIFMGLNTFFWSFLATYPALIYAWTLLH